MAKVGILGLPNDFKEKANVSILGIPSEACAGRWRREVGLFCRASEGQVRIGRLEDRSSDTDQ